MRAPRFDVTQAERIAAQAWAVADASAKAQALVREAGLRLSEVTRIEEI
jgi:uncharacterized protein YggE